jgi:pimeloyl-ACP methyl ester carboxylesterase
MASPTTPTCTTGWSLTWPGGGRWCALTSSAGVARTSRRPAFWRLNDDLLGAVFARRRRIPQLRRFDRPVQIIFGARDRSLNPRVARNLAALFPRSELHLLDDAGHFVQVDQPQQVADLIAAG